MAAKTEHELRMAWAGWFAHPTYDHDVFCRYPEWRKAEIMELQELAKNKPNAQTFFIYSPVTMQPYPDQILLRDIEKKIEKKTLAPVQLRYTIPNIPRGVFSVHYPDPTEEEIKKALVLLEQNINKEKVSAACTKNRELSNEKPINGAYAFIWRVARYSSGLDPLIPVTAFIDLMDGVNYFTRLKINPQVDPIMGFFDARAQELIGTIGGGKRFY